MKNGWTGGQYSLVRATFGGYLFLHFLALAIAGAATPLVVVAAIASVFFAIGLYDRIAAVLIWSVLAYLFVRSPLTANPSLPFAGCLLLVHAFVPPAPFGSWAARGRTDPRGGWTMPPALFAAMWIVMSLGYTFSGWTKWTGDTSMVRMLATLELLYAPLALFRRVRPWIWVAMLAMQLGLMVLIDFADLSFMMVLLHLFTFDPAWVKPRAAESTDTLQYDGSCGLCHRSVRFVLAEDRSGTAFHFQPLPSDGEQTSVIVQTADGRTLLRSDAVIHILQRLGGWWRVIGIAFGVLPRVVRNAMYDGVARVRYRIFGRTKDACPIVPPDLRSRFT